MIFRNTLNSLFFYLLSAAIMHFAYANPFKGEAVPGGVAAVDLGPVSGDRPIARYGSKRILVVENAGNWVGLVGLSLNTLPGEYIVSAKKQGEDKDREFLIKVAAKTYPEQRIKMKQKKYVSPDKEQLARITSEKKHMTGLFKEWREEDVSIELGWPVDGPLSSPFGLRRFFNDKPRKPHSGIDIAAPVGTDIIMPADGVIIDTGDYYFNGKTVFVDHGQGMISMLNHMSKISVKPGDRLKKGEKIGEVGKTGRVTGPHLHWSLSLNEVRVDPMLFLPAREK
jgi:murein DD-endopeptidase MepM/ murein hydrolase activator NlpD